MYRVSVRHFDDARRRRLRGVAWVWGGGGGGVPAAKQNWLQGLVLNEARWCRAEG